MLSISCNDQFSVTLFIYSSSVQIEMIEQGCLEIASKHAFFGDSQISSYVLSNFSIDIRLQHQELMPYGLFFLMVLAPWLCIVDSWTDCLPNRPVAMSIFTNFQRNNFPFNHLIVAYQISLTCHVIV